MSAFPDRPDDFLAWLGADARAGDFVPRSLYGDYVEATLAAAPIDVVPDEAVDVEPVGSGARVVLASGRVLAAEAVVFALGNAPPRQLPELAGLRGVVADPLGDSARLAPAPDDTVALVGTGLTALDVVAWLRAGGHRGRIVMVSRHGLLPSRHAPAHDVTRPLVAPTVRAVLAGLRRRGEANVDHLRPHVTSLWQSLDRGERRRFLRHARPYWDTHRHRAPPAIHALVAEGRAEGWLEVRAARLVRGSSDRLEIQPRGSGPTTVTLASDWIVNCTGPERDVARQPGRLVSALRRRGLIVPDALGLGVATGPAGELVAASGHMSPRLLTLGAWRVADLWESTAVPELRQQAVDVAERLAHELARSARPPLEPHLQT